MSTNYYLRRKPLLEQREELKRMIDQSGDGSNFKEILDMASVMYGTCTEYDRDLGVIHLGKKSFGWKFLWNPNIVKKDFGKYDQEKKTFIRDIRTVGMYDLSREGIEKFVMNKEYELYDEYGEKCDKEKFLNMALNSEGYDSVSYIKEHPEEKSSWLWLGLDKIQRFWADTVGCVFVSPLQSDFEIDGLRFSTSVEFS